jgi:hypothetical protein
MKSDSGKLLFRGYRVLLLAMILMFGLGAMPQASGMADDEPMPTTTAYSAIPANTTTHHGQRT